MDRKKQDKHLSKKSGFTLIEIILVVVIIGILAGIAIPRMGGRTEQANISKAQQEINGALGMAIQEYEMMNGTYPSSLDALLDSSKQGYPFLSKQVVPKDPWGNPYNYAAPGSHNPYGYDLSCTSPKGKVINNWE
jgi:general secretion pathway protein G